MEPAPATRIGRIRIDALLGAGGMGEVYRGWDETLERAVALKVVHADKRFSAAMRNRFLREARVLSKLDHPNICRIYDVLERDDGDYLVLELVEGVTLRQRMTLLSRREALDVALQVARVLAVTHERGIVHRDLKPDNVMLTPENQVKVLDFGLARPVVDPEHGQPVADTDFSLDDPEKTAVLGRRGTSTEIDDTHTSAGSLVGTLQYMSPEQARGLPLTEATDLYSLGIVLCELLTGRRAYEDAASMNELLVRVRTADVRPFDFGDRALNALVKGMLALQPSERPRAQEVVRALELAIGKPARIRRRLWSTLAATAVVLAIGGAFFASQLGTTNRLFASNTRGRLAILPFRNATGDRSLGWVQQGLAELVTEGISRVRGADVASDTEVVRTMRNLKLSPTLDLTTDAAAQQRRALLAALGADVAIQSTVVASDGKYTIRYAALRPEGAEHPQEATSTVLVEAARQMSTSLAQRIDPSTSTSALSARYSLDVMANTLLAMGIQEMRERGPKVAAHYFMVCLDRDPEFLVAMTYLANCRKLMGEKDEAERLLATALARAQQRNDRELMTRGLILRSSWSVEDGDYATTERTATEGLRLARLLGNDDLQASALTNLGNAAWRTGKLDRATALYQEALTIHTARRDAHNQAELHNNLGVVADSKLTPGGGRVHYEKALAIAERTNDHVTAVTVIGNLAGIYGEDGDFVRAEAMTRRQLVLARDVGDSSTEASAMVNLGLWLWAQGKERDAVAATEEAISLVERLGSPRYEAILHANLGTAYTKLGDLAAAQRHNALALPKAKTIDDPEVDRDVQVSLAYMLIRQGHLADAERELDQAERWQPIGRTTLIRARLAYARGDYAGAFALATRARTMAGPWLLQNEQMLRAFEESARTGRAAKARFESELM